MKKFKKLVALLATAAITLSMLAGSYCVSADDEATPLDESIPLLKTNGISPISGTFIQPWLYNGYSEETWEKEMQLYKKMGIEYIVMGDCASKADDGPWKMEYPSSLPGVQNTGNSVETILKVAQQYGMKVYLGMGNPHEWWNLDLSQIEDGVKFMEMAKMATSIAQELYDLYKAKYPDAFYGFYSVYEIWNHGSWDDEARRTQFENALSEGFNIIIDKINSLDPNMPLLFSPFATPGVSKLESLQTFYTNFITKTNFRKIDAICPMDNIGGGGTKIDELEPWTQAYHAAVEATNFKLQYWQNCENFVQPSSNKMETKNGINYWGNAPVGRFIRQMEIASKYATKIFSFSYSHYYSPNNNVGSYQTELENYLVDGKEDTTAPLPPDRIKVSKYSQDEEKGIRLEWDGMWDDVGISKVAVFKNGGLLDYRVTTRGDGTSSKVSTIAHTMVDYDFVPGEKDVKYEFVVTDSWGNQSERASFVVKADSPYRDDGLRGERYTDIYGEPAPEKPADWKLVQEQLEKKTEQKESLSQEQLVTIMIIAIIAVVIIATIAVVLILLKKNKAASATPKKEAVEPLEEAKTEDSVSDEVPVSDENTTTEDENPPSTPEE